MFGCFQPKGSSRGRGLRRKLGRRGKTAPAGRSRQQESDQAARTLASSRGARAQDDVAAQPGIGPSHAEQNGSAAIQSLSKGSPSTSTGIPALQQQSAQQLVREGQTGRTLFSPPRLRMNNPLGLPCMVTVIFCYSSHLAAVQCLNALRHALRLDHAPVRSIILE